MSTQPLAATPGVPVANRALEPAWVRHGSAATQRDYETALAFERVLVEELTKTMSAAAGLGGEGSSEGEGESQDGGGSAGTGVISSLLPQALAGGVVQAGGLGLAPQLTRELEGVHGAAAGRPGTAHAPSAPPSPVAAEAGGSAAPPQATPISESGGTAA
jgi:hypothetical protein